ncbi:MAG: fibronectin type III domain-containing protein [Lachnospiraceae bacterium]|nr:fibronectin type III domain-containing protein [Lachnospiraceae bacterium]
MKRQVLKSILCLTLSAAMVFGEAGAVLAETENVSVEAAEEAAVAEETQPETGVVQNEGESEAENTEAAEESEIPAAEPEAAAKEDTEAVETPEAEDTEAVETPAAEDTEAVEAPEAEGTETVEAPAAEEADEDIDAVGAKIVSPYTLTAVTGFVYDASTKVLSWNKVPNASGYKYEIINADGSYDDGSTSNLYLNLNNWGFTADKSYTIRVCAVNYAELYQVATGITGHFGSHLNEATGKEVYGIWSDGVYDAASDTYKYKLLYESGKDYDVTDSKETLTSNGTTTTYTLYKYPASTSWSEYKVTPNTTAEANARKTSITALSGVALKEINSGYAVFAVTPSKVREWESVRYTFSNNAAFQSDEEKQFFVSGENTVGESMEFSISLHSFNPGDTIYVKARTYNSSYELKAGQTDENRYSAPVSATYKVPKAEMSVIGTVVTASSIRLEPAAINGNVTGFEYQRKNGKKWTSIAKQSSDYTDSGLKADTKYTYRVRGYSFNEITKKTTYTDWKQVSAYTWGAALNLKASAASATSVKLTWSKVSKAQGYEIYRYDMPSSGYTLEKGEWKEYFDKATLVKTIKKAKTKSYTDKKLTKGSSYGYLVRAYRTVGKNKIYIDEYASVTLAAKGTISGLIQYYNTSGKLVVKWNKGTGISGYKVEKKDPATGKWVSYKNLKKAATTITLPQVKAGNADVTYRIRSYSGKNIYAATDDIIVEPKLAAVKNVKAVKTADGIKVTWNKVAGADYYRVIRTTKEASVYNKTTKTYGSIYGETVSEAVYDVSSSSDLAKKSQEKVNGTVYERIRISFSDAAYEAGNRSYTLDGKEYYVNKGWDDDDNPYYYINKEITYSATSYAYDPNLKISGSELYNSITSYETEQIKGTSVVDKEITVKKLVLKEDDPTYNKTNDPEYASEADEYVGQYGEYMKNADGSLKTQTVTKVEGPGAGNVYYYYVIAYAKASSGANENSNIAQSMGCTKGAEVAYTAKTAKAAKLSSVKSSKKASVTITAKKVKGAKGYAIYRSTKQKGTYVKVGTSTSTKYTDTNVVGGKTYYYKVASYVVSENGAYVYSKLSSAKKVKVKK